MFLKYDISQKMRMHDSALHCWHCGNLKPVNSDVMMIFFYIHTLTPFVFEVSSLCWDQVYIFIETILDDENQSFNWFWNCLNSLVVTSNLIYIPFPRISYSEQNTLQNDRFQTFREWMTEFQLFSNVMWFS